MFVNGRFCKDPKLATADDFFFSGLNKPGNTDNKDGSHVSAVYIDELPGLNTLGLAMARIDFALYGQNPPHNHPRGSEIFVVVEGQLLAGFVTSNQEDGSNRLFAKVLNPGDAFVFPVGLIHFQLNIGHTPALAYAFFNSQNQGRITIANALFGATPPINADILSRAFKLDKNIVEFLQKQPWPDNN